jgi:hypothetical protein
VFIGATAQNPLKDLRLAMISLSGYQVKFFTPAVEKVLQISCEFFSRFSQ